MERFRCFIQLKQCSRPRWVLECIKVLGKKIIIFSFFFHFLQWRWTQFCIKCHQQPEYSPRFSSRQYLDIFTSSSRERKWEFLWCLYMSRPALWRFVMTCRFFPFFFASSISFTVYTIFHVIRTRFFFFAKKYDVIRNMTGEVVVVKVKKEIEFHLLLKFQNRHFNLESSHFAKQITNRSSREFSHPLNYKLHVILFFAKLN